MKDLMSENAKMKTRIKELEDSLAENDNVNEEK